MSEYSIPRHIYILRPEDVLYKIHELNRPLEEMVDLHTEFKLFVENELTASDGRAMNMLKENLALKTNKWIDHLQESMSRHHRYVLDYQHQVEHLSQQRITLHLDLSRVNV